MNLIAVFIGGGLGSLARYGVSSLSKIWFKGDFPIGTLVSNVVSTTILAVVAYYFIKKNVDSKFLTPLIVIGFCGGFSTFSTFSLETFELFRTGNFSFAVANIVISISFCFLLLYFLYRFSQASI